MSASLSVSQFEDLVRFVLSNDIRCIPVTSTQYDELDALLVDQGLSVAEWESQWGVRLIRESCH